MKFIVSSTRLLQNVQQASGAISNSNTLPILNNFLLELDQNQLKITGSDLETTITTIVEVESTDVDSIAVPSKILLDILKSFPEQPLTFVKKEQGNLLEIVSEQGTYQLAYESADEFPQNPEIEDSTDVQIQSDVLTKALNKTVFATGNDELRPVMTGVFFQFNSEMLRFVATDAHRLAKYSRTDAIAKETIEFIVPKKSLNLVKNMLSPKESQVLIQYNQTNAKFSFNNQQLICRLIDGKYPNYSAVIPKENPNILTINRNLFLTSLRRVAIFSNKSTNQVRLKLSGSALVISAEDLDFSNKAEENLTVDYNGADLQIGFNSKFLIEMLNNLQSEDVLLEMSEPSRAGILKQADGLEEGEEILFLVMPVMLGS